MGQRIGLVGTFFPEYLHVGIITTGFAHVMAGLPEVEEVVIFAQKNASLPPGLPQEKVRILPLWQWDDPVSIANLFRTIISESANLDGLIFNTYITAFGRRTVANAAGMAGLVALPRLVRCPVILYLHNLMTTQDVESLGYHPNKLTRAAVQLCERLIVATQTVVVPLESQARKISETFDLRVRALFVPFLECVGTEERAIPDRTRCGTSAQRRMSILLFGTWGPQKDLRGALSVAGNVAHEIDGVTVTVAGESNTHFPEYSVELERLRHEWSSPQVRFIGRVPESDVPALFARHDILVLPYNATGGYSSVLSWAAKFGLKVLAYDLPALRENSGLLGIPLRFVPPRDYVALSAALKEALGERQDKRTGPPRVAGQLARSRVEDLMGMLTSKRMSA